MVQAKDTICSPTHQMTWFGIEFNSQEMTKKMVDIQDTLEQWGTRQIANKILGFLNFGCGLPPARIYANRMLQFLKTMPEEGFVELDALFGKDLYMEIKVYNK